MTPGVSRKRDRNGLTLRNLIVALGALVVVFLLITAVKVYSPSYQLRKSFDRLIHLTEQRNWAKFQNLLSTDYKDSWGYNRVDATSMASEIFRQFFAVTIHRSDETYSIDGKNGTVTARLKLEGNGTPMAQEAVRYVNALKSEFRFDWRRESWAPWSWKLVSITQPETQDLPETQ